MRTFIYYHGLFPYLADKLSAMDSVKSMLEFPQLTKQLTDLCTSISGRDLARNGPASNFTLIHSEIGEITLERSEWMECWIHQELPRLRADLVQYQREGGRMPPPVGMHEATPSTLARELTEGLRKGTEVSGGAGIEVGIFVIERSK